MRTIFPTPRSAALPICHSDYALQAQNPLLVYYPTAVTRVRMSFSNSFGFLPGGFEEIRPATRRDTLEIQRLAECPGPMETLPLRILALTRDSAAHAGNHPLRSRIPCSGRSYVVYRPCVGRFPFSALLTYEPQTRTSSLLRLTLCGPTTSVAMETSIFRLPTSMRWRVPQLDLHGLELPCPSLCPRTVRSSPAAIPWRTACTILPAIHSLRPS